MSGPSSTASASTSSSASPSSPRVVVHPTKQLLSDAIGARLLTALVDVQAERGQVSVVLTGGSLGSAVLASLGALAGRDAVDWTTVDVWWGDERFLPQGDPDRNETQNREALLDALPLDPARVRAMPGPDGPDGDDVAAAAARYAGWLAEAAGAEGAGAAAGAGDARIGVESPTFDILLLGVGPDGHVASLFPGHPDQLTAGVAAAPVRNSPKPPPTRITLTFEALNRADRVWFIVAGADKADAVAVSVAGAAPGQSSAAQVHGIRETLWLIDADAASRLPHG